MSEYHVGERVFANGHVGRNLWRQICVDGPYIMKKNLKIILKNINFKYKKYKNIKFLI